MTIQGVGSWKISGLGSERLRRVERGEQSLRLAVLKGDKDRAYQLVQTFASQAENGRGPWAKSGDRIKALQVSLDDAALANRPALIQLLVQYGAKPDYAKDPLAVSAIVVAARCGNIAAMNTLYRVGAKLSSAINPKDEAPTAARNAIEVAVEVRQNTAIMWLLQHGVRVCTTRESQRIGSFVAHPLAVGKLDGVVLRALRCATGTTSSLRGTSSSRDDAAGMTQARRVSIGGDKATG